MVWFSVLLRSLRFVAFLRSFLRSVAFMCCVHGGGLFRVLGVAGEYGKHRASHHNFALHVLKKLWNAKAFVIGFLGSQRSAKGLLYHIYTPSIYTLYVIYQIYVYWIPGAKIPP